MFNQINILLNKGPVRVLCLMLSLLFVSCFFWRPELFAAKTSSLQIWHGFILIWAACSGIIHGVGFTPHNRVWSVLFHPLLPLLIIVCGLLYFIY